MEAFAWMVVYDGNTFGTARTATFALPGNNSPNFPIT